MRLLIITQKVDRNDSVLGFFHAWLVYFAQHVETLVVICLEEGDHRLPENARVISLGKEKGVSRLGVLFSFFRILIRERKSYDTVFVHMNPIYLVLAGWYWSLASAKRAYLWYTHKHVDWKLWIAEKFVENVFTASKESFRLKSEKLIVMGHGIDADVFSPSNKEISEQFELLSVGRISRSKKVDILIESLRKIRDKGIDAVLSIVGAPITDDDEEYYDSLKNLVKDAGLEQYVTFVGAVTNNESVDFYRKASVFVHTSETGSLDKVALEAMACGLPVISSNDAVKSILSNHERKLVFEKGNTDDLVRSVMMIHGGEIDIDSLKKSLRDEVQQKHNISSLIKRLVILMEEGNV